MDNDWYPHARPETVTDIIERNLKICPELVPPERRDASREPTVQDVLPIVIESGCGFRPGRKGGIRLERDVFTTLEGTKVPIVYNYGWVLFKRL